VRALVDTGCSKSIVVPRLSGDCYGDRIVIAVDGSRVHCRGESIIPITIEGCTLTVSCVVADRLLKGVEAILGMDVITALGGVFVGADRVDFGRASATAAVLRVSADTAAVVVPETMTAPCANSMTCSNYDGETLTGNDVVVESVTSFDADGELLTGNDDVVESVTSSDADGESMTGNDEVVESVTSFDADGEQMTGNDDVVESVTSFDADGELPTGNDDVVESVTSSDADGELLTGNDDVVESVTSFDADGEQMTGNDDVAERMNCIDADGELLACSADAVVERMSSSSASHSKLVDASSLSATVTAPYVEITDRDFTAQFDGTKWVVKWEWKEGPPELRNNVSWYSSTIKPGTQCDFEKEIERWITNGWLRPWIATSDGSGVLPLMAVVQETKNKVRPCLDYRELNKHVECHTGSEVAICDETLRKWRRLPGRLKLVDLKSAYLQIHVEESLWPYQQVRYKGKSYCLTRLGFGLNCAPRIMTRILREVLAQEKNIDAATDHYVDDVIVQDDMVTAEKVVDHLKKYGLESKQPVDLVEGGRVLGLQLNSKGQGKSLIFSRCNEIPVVDGNTTVTKRKLFSICGKLVGHYPVAGWLRIACGFLKRTCIGYKWEDPAGQQAQEMLIDLLERVRADDPVRGKWHVPGTQSCRIWCDASSLAYGVVAEVAGEVIEDAAWLRKTDDYAHINVAELEAILKGLNLAIKWDMKEIEIMTDSASVQSWLRSTLTEDHRVKTHGAAEMLIKRRLAVFRELVTEYNLSVSVTFTRSERNRADSLTRVKRSWLSIAKPRPSCNIACVALEAITNSHQQHHSGVNRSLYLARQTLPQVTREQVTKVIRSCKQCQSIDPAPVQHEPGKLSVESNWKRLAVDVTHYRGRSYLSMVDCGPSRFAIWREVAAECAASIVRNLDQVFRERGPVEEVLVDNSTTFHSQAVAELCQKWNVKQWFRAAHRASGNGIVERHHRTIKRMAARADAASPLEMVFWYNMAPTSGVDKASVPWRQGQVYEWRHPDVRPPDTEGDKPELQVGDEVWVKPPDARCTSRWTSARVTKINSRNNIDVDGMARHILDVRPVVDGDNDDSDDESENEDINHGARYPVRQRIMTQRYGLDD
jgi:ribonuclease HI